MSVEPYRVPFTVIVDSAESQAFTFQGLFADAVKDLRALVVPTKYSSLGRFPNGLGDYSIEGLTDRVAIERKSREDVWGTVMGWETDHQKENGGTGRRDRFKSELENLAKIDASMVVVEASLGNCLANVPEWGTKTRETNRKIFFRSVLAMQQDYRVPWLFCDSRWLAEIATFRFLERFYRKSK